MTVNFNPRLRPLDIALVLLALVVITPMAFLALNGLRPTENNMPWALRSAFLSALIMLFVRGRFFGPPEPGPIVAGGRALIGLLIIGVGGTIIAIGALVLLAMSEDVRLSTDLLWLLVPFAVLGIGCAVVVLGARLRIASPPSAKSRRRGATPRRRRARS